MRNLAAIDAVDEVGTEEYKASKISRAFAQPKGISGAKFLFVHPYLRYTQANLLILLSHFTASTSSTQCG